ncbi:hypothetical protein BDN71DRAFT_759893 [Pleurotus eryngii]|uniref:Uncharacterized protein n=1 Tax=Pleurotus eryngii TaxID=5323 RepID=A0A9P5ZFW7_PLEER|nr:hypothetical protein BDN71DRAFT_759893 [Pleurotus eryngii]
MVALHASRLWNSLRPYLRSSKLQHGCLHQVVFAFCFILLCMYKSGAMNNPIPQIQASITTHQAQPLPPPSPLPTRLVVRQGSWPLNCSWIPSPTTTSSAAQSSMRRLSSGWRKLLSRYRMCEGTISSLSSLIRSFKFRMHRKSTLG